MRLVACSLVVFAACNTNDGDDYPVEPGGGGGTFGTTIGSGGTDAGATDGGGLRTGRVCGLDEILVWSECAQTGLQGFVVTVGAETAMTMADGSFEIAEPTGSNLRWRVVGSAQQMTSLRGFPADNRIPSISNAFFQDLAADAGVAPDNNVGTLFVEVTYKDAPLAEVTATLADSQELVYYDDPNGSAKFSVGQTREAGMIWFPNVAPGPAVTVTVTPPVAVGAPVDIVVIVETETATFATVEF
jgi:hypothetical protein